MLHQFSIYVYDGPFITCIWRSGLVFRRMKVKAGWIPDTLFHVCLPIFDRRSSTPPGHNFQVAAANTMQCNAKCKRKCNYQLPTGSMYLPNAWHWLLSIATANWWLFVSVGLKQRNCYCCLTMSADECRFLLRTKYQAHLADEVLARKSMCTYTAYTINDSWQDSNWGNLLCIVSLTMGSMFPLSVELCEAAEAGWRK